MVFFVSGVLTPATAGLSSKGSVLKERRFVDSRVIIPVLTEDGITLSFSHGFKPRGKTPMGWR